MTEKLPLTERLRNYHKCPSLHHSDVIKCCEEAANEIERLRTERDEAREAAIRMYNDTIEYDPANNADEWRLAYPWLAEQQSPPTSHEGDTGAEDFGD